MIKISILLLLAVSTAVYADEVPKNQKPVPKKVEEAKPAEKSKAAGEANPRPWCGNQQC